MSMLALLLSLIAAPPAPPGAPAAADGVQAVTAPSEDHTMVSLDRPGRVAEVLVAEGGTVRAGQVLVRMDDAVDRIELALAEAKAANTTAIRASQIRLDRARAVLAEVSRLHETGAAPQRELAEAKINAAMAELQLEMDRFEQAQAKGNADRLRLRIERMKLTSPVGGRVERMLVKPGQYIDALAPIARIVEIDPLWIDVPVPLPQARTLRLAGRALVRFDDGTGAAGRIVRVASLADAGSETLEVRVELPNPSRRPAREHVTVRFPPAGGAPDKPAPLGPLSGLSGFTPFGREPDKLRLSGAPPDFARQ